MDFFAILVPFWPVALTLLGGGIARNVSSKLLGVSVLVGMSILAVWLMGRSALDPITGMGALLAGAILGLTADREPLVRELRDLFGQKRKPPLP